MRYENEELERKKVISYALNFTFSWDYLSTRDNLSLEKKSLVKLFASTDNLRNFLDYFPTPPKGDIRKIEDIELKKSFVFIRKKRMKLENFVVKTAVGYYNNFDFLDKKDPIFAVKEQFFDAVVRYKNF
jgi:hypothetical protein